jgi:hypothetical protein
MARLRKDLTANERGKCLEVDWGSRRASRPGNAFIEPF